MSCANFTSVESSSETVVSPKVGGEDGRNGDLDRGLFLGTYRSIERALCSDLEPLMGCDEDAKIHETVEWLCHAAARD